MKLGLVGFSFVLAASVSVNAYAAPLRIVNVDASTDYNGADYQDANSFKLVDSADGATTSSGCTHYEFAHDANNTSGKTQLADTRWPRNQERLETITLHGDGNNVYLSFITGLHPNNDYGLQRVYYSDRYPYLKKYMQSLEYPFCGTSHGANMECGSMDDHYTKAGMKLSPTEIIGVIGDLQKIYNIDDQIIDHIYGSFRAIGRDAINKRKFTKLVEQLKDKPNAQLVYSLMDLGRRNDIASLGTVFQRSVGTGVRDDMNHQVADMAKKYISYRTSVTKPAPSAAIFEGPEQTSSASSAQ